MVGTVSFFSYSPNLYNRAAFSPSIRFFATADISAFWIGATVLGHLLSGWG